MNIESIKKTINVWKKKWALEKARKEFRKLDREKHFFNEHNEMRQKAFEARVKVFKATIQDRELLKVELDRVAHLDAIRVGVAEKTEAAYNRARPIALSRICAAELELMEAKGELPWIS